MAFPAPHIHPAQTTHTHTAILLHGRGSKGPEFADELFSSMTSQAQTLPDALPTWRWVFPTSRDRLSTRFQEEICSWFDAYSLSDIEEQQDLQIEGLRESVLYILEILEQEISLLGGNASHVYLGGISQGMATALWTLFCAGGRIELRLGGVLGFCGWIPFAHEIGELVRQSAGSDVSQAQGLVCSFCVETLGLPQSFEGVGSQGSSLPLLRTRFLLGHGTDDIWVPVELGRQALQVIKGLSVGGVDWIEYAGAEGDGHWIKEPEGLDFMLKFLGGGSQFA
ncbi:alpha/beta-hydrolase [Aspergillus uvarum CBS 121591]|uniref:Alpha/beta-hydrolase n=1 Tax=Aspergillus uvarum CBS 121591 TaxID=1448315 RepID=A0A319C4J6_9EURO|nr:alpha/beta-hydrolase [Aspergillus uvarum CBS 121591]PYH80074.1 alpha/beta-hydrolase [Aspergillus uvarum CBS 121591]